ncbi:hypothetical protein TH66_02090 [Carbonactinospora thermoautotrophica]|uniref:Enoyl-CoA hydratase n=1 Tax=Carbonactinospora thermoautotrophica TaxID=1469144 RepID=A0A132NGT2_9ACTN|nr:enoyl-CoA hydratase/isomerase family protein [Carbonactinospora thermoautotrophica]KWX05494.1 hypothetical protein TH66_02090 [Carbonactinospora thermoautotrophica]KWX09279.1 hypothetical protein TR74_10560 [Carbonactinospora thermoautotrophica]
MTVTVQRAGGVAEIVLDRPEQRNPLDYHTARAVVSAMREQATAPDVGAILIWGRGKGFCAGADLKEFSAQAKADALSYHDSGQVWADMFTVPRQLDVPVVVAAHGFALAGACGLVAAADIALAAEGTQFGMSEIRIGLFPVIAFPALARAVGPRRARELALTGRRIDAAEALVMGLVHRVLPAEGFIDAAREMARDIASLGRDALRLGKELMRQAEDLDLDAAVAHAKAARGAFLATPDFAEGLDAFLTKRAPRFRAGAGAES